MKLIEILTLSTFAFSMLFIGILGYMIIKDAKKNMNRNMKKSTSK